MLGYEPSGSLVVFVGRFGLVAVMVLAGVMEAIGNFCEQLYCRKSILCGAKVGRVIYF